MNLPFGARNNECFETIKKIVVVQIIHFFTIRVLNLKKMFKLFEVMCNITYCLIEYDIIQNLMCVLQH